MSHKVNMFTALTIITAVKNKPSNTVGINTVKTDKNCIFMYASIVCINYLYNGGKWLT